jgi:hypothetical protein
LGVINGDTLMAWTASRLQKKRFTSFASVAARPLLKLADKGDLNLKTIDQWAENLSNQKRKAKE